MTTGAAGIQASGAVAGADVAGGDEAVRSIDRIATAASADEQAVMAEVKQLLQDAVQSAQELERLQEVQRRQEEEARLALAKWIANINVLYKALIKHCNNTGGLSPKELLQWMMHYKAEDKSVPARKIGPSLRALSEMIEKAKRDDNASPAFLAMLRKAWPEAAMNDFMLDNFKRRLFESREPPEPW